MKKTVKIAVDVAMALALVAVMATAIVEAVPHEWLGIALFLLVTAHIVLNCRWLASVFRGRYSALRVLQVVTIVGLVACLVGQVASSLVLSKYAFGFLPALPGAGWARRVHMLCSYWMFVFAFAHAGLHIRVPKRVEPRRLLILRLMLVAVSCYGLYSFVRLGLLPYLLGQIQFFAADYETPLAVTFARYASVGVLIATLSHCLQVTLELRARKERAEAAGPQR